MCLTGTEPSSLLRSDLGFRTERRGSEIRPPGAGPPPSEIPAPGTRSGRLRPPPRARPAAPARARARPHIHTHRSTYRPLRGDVGREPQAARRACAGLLARPSAPRGLSPRPPVGEAADPRGSEGRARSQARAGEPGPSLLHMEPGPGDGRAALRGRRESLGAPRCFSLERGPEARGKLGRKGGSRGPGAARGQRRGRSGDSLARGAGPPGRRPRRRRASRWTPERRNQRPHHPRQAPPLRVAGPPLHTDQ